jgi:hypothetical protein
LAKNETIAWKAYLELGKVWRIFSAAVNDFGDGLLQVIFCGEGAGQLQNLNALVANCKTDAGPSFISSQLRITSKIFCMTNDSVFSPWWRYLLLVESKI